MKRNPRLGLFLIILGTLCASESRAWRETGHFAVCEIAYRHLESEARKKVDEILGGKDFPTQCTWPDMVRHSDDWSHTYPWHFINLDDGLDYFDAVNPEGDVLQALLLAEAELSQPETAAEDMRRYLRFLAHFAGDSHQPLHAGRKVDLGGNEIPIRWFGDRKFESIAIELVADDDGSCSEGERYVDPATGECILRDVAQRDVNLHKVWDLLMIQRFIAKQRLRAETGDSEFLHKAYATAVEGLVSGEELGQAAGASFQDWVEESLEARAAAYDVGRGKLGRRYYRRNIGLLSHRIALAGHRLAFTLNRLLGPAGDSPESAALAARHQELRGRLVELAGGDSPLARALR